MVKDVRQPMRKDGRDRIVIGEGEKSLTITRINNDNPQDDAVVFAFGSERVVISWQTAQSLGKFLAW